jgi:hypothetical protein
VAASSGRGDLDENHEPEAYNRSIYLMAFMPYVLLTGLGLMFYRSVRVARKKAQREPTIQT